MYRSACVALYVNERIMVHCKEKVDLQTLPEFQLNKFFLFFFSRRDTSLNLYNETCLKRNTHLFLKSFYDICLMSCHAISFILAKDVRSALDVQWHRNHENIQKGHCEYEILQSFAFGSFIYSLSYTAQHPIAIVNMSNTTCRTCHLYFV